MIRNRRQFSREFKITLLRELEGGKTMGELSRENEISATMIAKWRREYVADPSEAFQGKRGEAKREEAKLAQLEGTIGRLHVENEFLKKTLENLDKRFVEHQKRARQK